MGEIDRCLYARNPFHCIVVCILIRIAGTTTTSTTSTTSTGRRSPSWIYIHRVLLTSSSTLGSIYAQMYGTGRISLVLVDTTDFPPGTLFAETNNRRPHNNARRVCGYYTIVRMIVKYFNIISCSTSGAYPVHCARSFVSRTFVHKGVYRTAAVG